MQIELLFDKTKEYNFIIIIFHREYFKDLLKLIEEGTKSCLH